MSMHGCATYVKGIKRVAALTCTVTFIHKIYNYSTGSEILSFMPALLFSSCITTALNGFVVNENAATEGLERENMLA